jgi:hypothetical protein
LTEIKETTFYGCSALEEIVIPQSVTTIETKAFQYCRSLMHIIIPEGVSIVAEKTFEYCDLLYSVTIPSTVIEIEMTAFKECINLSVINYNGVADEWTNIKKGFWWDYKTADYIIYLNDGTNIP